MFGAVRLTKNADIDKYKYCGFSFPGGVFGCNVIIFGLDMSLPARLIQARLFCLSLHYNRANSYLFVNGTEIHKSKSKDSETVATPICLANVSKDFSVDNMNKTGLNGYVYDFSVDYDANAVDDISGIHKYLMKMNNMI